QSEPRAHFEIILHIEGEHGLTDTFIAFFTDRHTAEKLRPGQDQVFDVLKCVLASRFRLHGVVILDAADDTAPFEVVPALHVSEVVAKLPEVIYPESGKVGVGSDVADCRSSALLTDG